MLKLNGNDSELIKFHTWILAFFFTSFCLESCNFRFLRVRILRHFKWGDFLELEFLDILIIEVCNFNVMFEIYLVNLSSKSHQIWDLNDKALVAGQ